MTRSDSTDARLTPSFSRDDFCVKLSSHITRHHIIQYYTLLYDIIFYYIKSCHIVAHRIMSCHIMQSNSLSYICLITYTHIEIIIVDLFHACINLVTHSPIGNCCALCASSLYRPKIDAAPSGEITPKYPPDSICTKGENTNGKVSFRKIAWRY